MNTWLGAFGVLMLVLVIAWWQVPLVRTAFLIARVTPYTQSPAQSTHTLLVLGDSTGYGTGATASENSVAGLIGRDFQELTIYNDSVNGRTLSEGLAAYTESHMTQSYDVVLLQLGANDILRNTPLSEVKVTLEKVLSMLKDSKVIMMPSGNVGAAPRFSGSDAAELSQRTLEYFAVFESLAAMYGATFVNLYQPESEDPFVQQPERYVSLDGLHPSDEGYAFWYTKLRPALEANLQ